MLSKQGKAFLFALLWAVIWQLAAIAIDNQWLFAGPIDTCIVWVKLVFAPSFWESIGRSLANIAAGFMFAFIAGSLLGYLSAKHNDLHLFLRPPISVIKSAPVVCAIALLLVIAGSRQTTTIVVALVVFPQFYHAIMESTRSRRRDLDDVLYAFRIPQIRFVAYVELMSFFASVRAAISVSIGLAWKSGVAAELIGLPSITIGEGIYLSKISLDSASIIAWTATVILLSWASEKVALVLLDVSQRAIQRLLALRVKRALEGIDHQCDEIPLVPKVMEPCGAMLEDVVRVFARSSGDETIEYRDMVIPVGSRICVMAPSGYGKTTLLRMLACMNKPSSGSIIYFDGKDDRIVMPTISVMLQDSTLVKWANALENIALVSVDSEEIKRGKAYLDRVSLGDSAYKASEALSGGMRRRVELCRALAHESSIVVLDEPFAGLDTDTKKRCIDLIEETLQGRTLIVATHDHHDADMLQAQLLDLRQPRSGVSA